jgi:HYDIN/CFA65/VesB-like, Ig-like domain
VTNANKRAPGLIRASLHVWGRRIWSSAALVLLAALFLAAPAHAATASWSFDPSTYDFGIRLPESGPSPPKAFTLTNTGEVELSVFSVGIAGSLGAGFAIAEDTCGRLAPGASCTVEVTFEPSSAGPKQGQLSVYDLEHEVSATAELRGAGAGPAVSITPASVAFEPLALGAGPSPPRTLTVANEGQLDLTISSLSIDSNQVYNYPDANPQQFELAGGACQAGLVVPPEGSCTVTVTFSPSAPGALSANLRIADNAPGSPHQAMLEGYGVAPPFSLPPPPPFIAPRAAIFHRPSKQTTKRRAAFWFRGSPTAARFECGLDSRPFAPCESPVRLEHLKLGAHLFAIRAIDGNGLSGPSPTQFRWRIEKR